MDGKTSPLGGSGSTSKSSCSGNPDVHNEYFKFPKELCEDIQSIINKFWWRHTLMDSWKIHLVRKDQLCKEKLDSELGFRDLDVFNTTLLTR